ncbi:MAG TPA: reverse transcriptase family protein, partial [Nitrososphaerales archaeon]|nr:reverse transcriptase family protein [Nitrososphaerales archaeon]
MECPEGNKGHGGKSIVKVESVEQPVVKSDQESSPYVPIPTIRIPVRIANAKTPALIDTGASVNTVSPRVTGRTKLPCLPVRPPIRIGQAFHPTGVLVKEKISARISIPSKNWTSNKPADFLVAPLANSEAVLGMPFLVQEQIKVNPAAHYISLPIPKAPKARPATTRTLNLKRTHAKLAQPDPRLITNASNKPRLMDTPSPTTSLGINVPWKPVLTQDEARRYHKEVVKEFPELFADKLPPRSQRKINSDTPVHRIELKDPRKTINGRLFALPEKFLNSMIDFLEEHLLAGHIRPLKSSFAAGTWMIPKKDPSAMPRVMHDYRALNENTVKDHTPLPRQDLIIRQLAKAKYRRKLDCPNSYYQMAMHPDDVHKTAFKTPFGLFEWLVMPQGLCNVPATWQRFMNWVLRKYVGKICHVYIDDIAIFSDSLLEHHRNIRLVLQA